MLAVEAIGVGLAAMRLLNPLCCILVIIPWVPSPVIEQEPLAWSDIDVVGCRKRLLDQRLQRVVFRTKQDEDHKCEPSVYKARNDRESIGPMSAPRDTGS